MDRRGWLWKKKSSDKILNAEKPVAAAESVTSTLSSVAHLGDQQDSCKNKNYVQISMESYSHMCGMEDQVKALEAKLSAAYSELNNKDNLVKQHAKVAEEAVTGWEKADAEVVSLRRQLESITLSKLAVDDRAFHLDGALKECMRQITTVQEYNEQKLQEVILIKSQQWEKVKLDLEAKIDKLDQALHQEANQNAALLRSLQDSSNKIVRLKEEKSEVEAEVEVLKKNVQSCEKEIASVNYELHMVSKELDIRNEEKNIIMRSAEVVNKQHAEDVKNIAKLEAECQRLRSLLRKKLPGPAALAQMKIEATNGPYLRKTHLKADSLQESEFPTKQLEVLEEETKTLKEALATSNAELQASRNLYAKTVDRLKSLEAEIQVFRQEKSAINFGNSSNRITNGPPSITSISDDGHEDPESPAESCAASIPDLSDIRRGTSGGKFENSKSETILELMDDFLEVEKMACLSDRSNAPLSIISKVNGSGKSDTKDKHLDDTPKAEDSDYLPIFKRLQSIISVTVANSETNDSSIWKLLEHIQGTTSELRDYLPRASCCPLCLKSNHDDASSCQQSLKIGMPVTEDIKVDTDFGAPEDVASAVTSIRYFVLTLGRETARLQGNSYDGCELDVNSEEFSSPLSQFITSKTSLQFVLKLSQALTKIIESRLNYMGYKDKREDISSSNDLDTTSLNEMNCSRDGCFPFRSTTEVPNEDVNPLNFVSYKYSSEKFKQMKSEKDVKACESTEYMQDLKETKLMLQEKEQLLADLKEQLASSHKSYSLAEIQLRCMTESYKSLQTHVEELEAQSKFLQEKIEELNNDLVEQKQCHHDELLRYREIEEKMQRDKCLICGSNFAEDNGINTTKDAELAAAEKKLVECQETLYILGRQLKALCPQIDITTIHHGKRLQINDTLVKPSHGWLNSNGSCNSNEIDQAEACSISSDIQGVNDEFSSPNCGSLSRHSDTEGSFSVNSSIGSSQPGYTLTELNSPSAATGKHAHGLSHFFLLKGKNGH